MVGCTTIYSVRCVNTKLDRRLVPIGWESYIFKSRGWRLRPNSLSAPLSDGKTPASGSMTMFATALVIAKDVSVQICDKSPQKCNILQAAKAATDLSIGPFSLKGGDQRASGLHWTPALTLRVGDNGLQPSGMQIIGFMCSVLPRCPNPSDGLQW